MPQLGKQANNEEGSPRGQLLATHADQPRGSSHQDPLLQGVRCVSAILWSTGLCVGCAAKLKAGNLLTQLARGSVHLKQRTVASWSVSGERDEV